MPSIAPKRLDHGGPAFPIQEQMQPAVDGGNAWLSTGQPGMTLRQWYAGQALMGILARPCDHKRTAEQHANEARQLADAMIEAGI